MLEHLQEHARKKKNALGDNESQDDRQKQGDNLPKLNSKMIRMCLETLTRNIDRITKQEEENQEEFLVGLDPAAYIKGGK